MTAVDHVRTAAPAGAEDLLHRSYGGALGMTGIPGPPAPAARGGSWFQGGAVRLHLGIEADFRPVRKAHPGLRGAGIDACAARLRGHGAPVVRDDHLPGHRRFSSEDPVGNRLEFPEPGA
ncbi:glyoxalase [Streptomyces sp. CC210A]|uniref:glyoxalase n=1 Tax=Streptomyces sp. CC210A TaxID=2898184 RepID=UPI001F1E1D27|nr:glyoxalase [Streptomyces sp. CC210A]